MKKNPVLLLGLFAITSAASADESFPDIRIEGLVDARLAFTSGTQSWFDHGLGKTRYGGSNGDDQIIGRIAEGSLLVLPQFNWSWSGTLHLKYDQEQKNPIDIAEGFLSYRPVSTSANRLSARFGAFFPPVSLENTGLAWTSPLHPYTLGH